MSLLWPESITVGLFPGSSWLRRGGGEPARVEVDAHAGPQQLLAALEALLTAQEKPLRKGARLRVLVSDSVGAVTMLPWQELLDAPAELRVYAQSCFAGQGVQLGEGWVLQTGFRRFRSAGLAYALPQPWLEALLALLAERGLRLASVLPLSAAAYWRLDGGRGTAPPSLLLLRERGRLSAMVRQGRRLIGTDVQPTAGGEDQALLRLLRRIAAAHPDLARVETWCAGGGELAGDAIAACFPDAVLRVLPHGAWS